MWPNIKPTTKQKLCKPFPSKALLVSTKHKNVSYFPTLAVPDTYHFCYWLFSALRSVVFSWYNVSTTKPCEQLTAHCILQLGICVQKNEKIFYQKKQNIEGFLLWIPYLENLCNYDLNCILINLPQIFMTSAGL